MRARGGRPAALAAAGAAAAALAVVGLGACGGGDGSGYRVRAIFDSAASAVPGSDVRIAGATVGRVESIDLTRDRRAALVLQIDDDRFTPFRSDARCTIRPQSLISEKFVECEPGTAGHGRLRRLDGGEEVLPLRRTRSPVDLDVVYDTMRLPERERLAIVLSELGTGLAGRGQDLNAAIHRANPALRETDDLLAILARQSRTLGGIAERSDPILAGLARQRRRVAGFVRNAGRTAEATAERRRALYESIGRLPGFLREVRSLMDELGELAGDAAPGVRDLRAAAPDVSRTVTGLQPFARAATPAVKDLGELAVSGRPALIRTLALARDLRTLGRDAAPVARDLDRLTASLDRTGAVRRILDYLFFQTTAINGFDDLGHYLRVALVVNLCSTFAVDPTIGCEANFGAAAGAARNPRAAGSEPRIARQGDAPAGQVTPAGRRPGSEAGRRALARQIRERARGPSPALQDAQPLFDYLLGEN